MATLLEKHLKLEEIKKIRNWRNEGYGLEKIKELVDKTNITDEEIEQIFYENSEKTQNEEKLDLLETNENSNKPEQQTERNIKEQNEAEFIYNNSEFVSEEVDEDEIEDLEEIEENKIEIEEENTIDDIKVEKGDQVKQGDVIGKAGNNVYQSTLKKHLHFIVSIDDKTVNPDKYFNQKIEKIKMSS